jgi:DNA-binding NtrC family response regulator
MKDSNEARDLHLQRIQTLLASLQEELRFLADMQPAEDVLSHLLGKSPTQIERELLTYALKITKGNRTQAARLLRVTARTVRNKVKRYGLPPRSGT